MGNLQKHKYTSGRARGFTRTDLVAGIAALAVIAGLALPGLAVSNNGSSRAVCFNNLRQMGLAMSMYAGDYRDYLAFCNWDGGYASAPGYLYGPGAPPDPTVAANYAWAWQSGLWFKYVNDPNAYLCPLDIRLANYQQRNNKLCSYVMDGAACGFVTPPPLQTTKISLIWSPGCYMMWEPDSITGPEGAFEYNDGANYPTAPPAGIEGIGLLHTQTGANILRCDGGVACITSNNFALDSNTQPGTGPGPGGKTRLWWSPFTRNGH